MKILGINGSPRSGGNTQILLDKVLEGAGSGNCTVETIRLNDLDFVACQECEDLPDDEKCIIDDGMRNVYAGIEKADIVVFASPIFFGSISAQSKMMIDRFHCLWRAKHVLNIIGGAPNKKGFFIAVSAADKKDYFHNAASVVKNFFATIGAEYTGELFCGGIENKEDILGHPEILEQAFELGRKLGEDVT